MRKAIPSNFQVILDTLRPFVRDTRREKHRALKLTDRLMEALPRPPHTCLCACNRTWIPLVKGNPVDAEGHGWDDCPARREAK